MQIKFRPGMPANTPAVSNLIIINVLVYVAQVLITNPFNFTDWGMLHYFTAHDFKPHQLVTSFFLHDPEINGQGAGIFHILFNMFTLWMFGTEIERYLGSKRFLIFYFICGIGASLFIELMIPFSASIFAHSSEGLLYNMPTDVIIEQYKQQYAALGASGAVMGVMAAYAHLFPNRELYFMIIPIPFKAKFIIPFLIFTDLFLGVRQFKGDNVGHFAHVGGALIGFLIILFWNKTNRKTFY